MVDENSEEEGESEREPQSLVEQHKANLKKKSKRELKEEQRRKEEEEKADKEERLKEVYIFMISVVVFNLYVDEGILYYKNLMLALHCDLVSINFVIIIIS